MQQYHPSVPQKHPNRAANGPEPSHWMRTSFCIVALICCARPAVGQTCADPHYRWTEKTAETLASETPTRTTIRAMLTTWALPAFTGQAQYQCAPREGRELTSYSLLGWVRRVKTGEADGDWHIELTSRSDSPVDSCIVVEIPPGDAGGGGNFAQARTDLQRLASWNANGDVVAPVRLRFIGAAFFDGEHRGSAQHRDRTDGAHGRCNSSARALWELHPVYWVKQP